MLISSLLCNHEEFFPSTRLDSAIHTFTGRQNYNRRERIIAVLDRVASDVSDEGLSPLGELITRELGYDIWKGLSTHEKACALAAWHEDRARRVVQHSE